MRLTKPLPLFMLMVLFSPIAIDIFLPGIPAMARHFAVSVEQIQINIPLFLFSFGIGQLVAGPIADRYGRRPVALFGVVLYLLSSIVIGLADSYSVLITFRLIQGISAACLTVTAFAGVRDVYGAEKSKTIFSYLNGLICIIPAAAPVLGSYLAVKWGWQASFWFMAGYALLVGCGLALRLNETRPSFTVSHGVLFNTAQYTDILKDIPFRFHSGLIMLGMAMIIGYATQSPQRLMVEMQLDGQSFAFWFGGNAIISIIASLLAPTWIKKLQDLTALWLGTGLMLSAGIASLFLQSSLEPLMFMGPVFVSSIGFCIIIAVSTGSALAAYGEKAGTASALLGLLQMSGSALIVALLAVSGLSAQMQLSLCMMFPIIWLVYFQRAHHS